MLTPSQSLTTFGQLGMSGHLDSSFKRHTPISDLTHSNLGVEFNTPRHQKIAVTVCFKYDGTPDVLVVDI